jgi:predicted small metal-binding protein
LGGNVKTLTCKQLGGICDYKISSDSWDDMVRKMTRHVMEFHPEVARRMEQMHDEDPKKWGREMKPKFDAA